jgi:hypothetical protein
MAILRAFEVLGNVIWLRMHHHQVLKNIGGSFEHLIRFPIEMPGITQPPS